MEVADGDHYTTACHADATVFESHESNVRSYCRSFPAVFQRAKGAIIYAESGKAYIDFFAGAGGLNYGHNNPFIKERIVAHLQDDGITHGLDFYTTAKRQFIASFVENILSPRGLDYKLQFTGPTGTNAVEAALKVARKATGRSGIFAFMGGYHGMSLGSLAATGNLGSRGGAGVALTGVHFMPFPHGALKGIDSIEYMEALLTDSHSGVEKPAAVILETVQAEGGVVPFPTDWLRRLRELCDRHAILMIVDDIQVGCFRTGPFFSFEPAGIVPDVVTLSKSISGYGLPMSLVLIRPQYDIWKPGEHTGTFRGHQLAFVGAAAAIDYAREHGVEAQVARKGEWVGRFLKEHIATLDARLEIRGVGLIWGIDFAKAGGSETANRVSTTCFENGLIAETCGRRDAVVKLLPPLTIDDALLEKGCQVIRDATSKCINA